MNDRDKLILAHLGLYRISLRPVMARMFFDGNDTALGNVLRRLSKSDENSEKTKNKKKKEGLICARTGLSGNMSYYQLTRAGATAIGVPIDRSENFGDLALDQHLAILWFCCMTDKPRFRIEDADVQNALKVDIPGSYCVGQEGEGLRMFRVYAPTESTQKDSLLRTIKSCIEKLESNDETAAWLKARTLGLGILVRSAGQRKSVIEIMRSPRRGSTLLNRTIYRVEIVPSFSTLQSTIKNIHELKHNTSKQRRAGDHHARVPLKEPQPD